MGHKDDCQCEVCTDYRQAQAGLDLLKKLKEIKAADANKKGTFQLEVDRIAIKIEPGETVSFHRCGSCGKAFKIGSDSRFCPYCGNQFVKNDGPQVVIRQNVVVTQLKICKRCATGVAQDAKSCPTCGEKFPE